MTRIVFVIAAVLIGSSSYAGSSDRYHDIRLDTALSATERPNSHAASIKTNEAKATFATKSSGQKKPYAYRNRFGVGPYNDSR